MADAKNKLLKTVEKMQKVLTAAEKLKVGVATPIEEKVKK
ncbi:hypothetical protein ES708_08941 [subsurface metagenome]